MGCSSQCKKIPANVTMNVQSQPSEDSDDIWGSDEDAVSPYADLKRAHINYGYLDGITQAQETGLQQGFDDGYPKGAELGMLVGEVLAKCHGTTLFDQAKSDLNITKVLDKQYFDDQLDLFEESHVLIKKWQEPNRVFTRKISSKCL